MALSTVTRSIGGVNKTAYVVDGTGDTERVILTETLMAIDVKYLNLADASAGANLGAKLAATTLPNGRKADKFFESRIELTIDLNEKARKNSVRGGRIQSALIAIEDRVADLEDRVTVLEQAAP